MDRRVLTAVTLSGAVVAGLVLTGGSRRTPSGSAPTALNEDNLTAFNLRQLAELHPGLACRVREILLRSPEQLVITDAYRSTERQDELYRQGRETPGPIVTHVRGGHSWHNHRLAADLAQGVASAPRYPSDRQWWEDNIGRPARELGLIWGGDWKPQYRDLPHVEYHPGIGIQDAIAGNIPDYDCDLPARVGRGPGRRTRRRRRVVG